MATVLLEDCRFIRETDAAILVEYEGNEQWVPKSLIHEPDLHNLSPHMLVAIEVPEWFANKEGLI